MHPKALHVSKSTPILKSTHKVLNASSVGMNRIPWKLGDPNQVDEFRPVLLTAA
jgi:hypothetical protein